MKQLYAKIAQDYVKGLSLKALKQKYNVGDVRIKQALKENKVQMRSRKNNQNAL